MKNFLKLKVWPVIAGLLTAFIIMTLFEYINSFIFPLPVGTNINDIYQLHAFTASLPWTAYILVLLGWIAAAFKAGCVVTYLSKESTYKLSLLTGAILTLFGLFNNLVIGHDMIFNVIALPMFIVFTYLGHKYVRKVLAKRKR
jgi:hypothetical protein